MTDSFPIVGIGASAGGIEALEGFFGGLPGDPGLALVIVTHLNPERESVLHQIVARHTRLPVQVAQDGMAVEANRVYVMPADAILSIGQRRLLVRRTGPGRRERNPIDIFFSALAVDAGELAAGVVLSGGDGDGSLGIKAIKERGGLTLAQVADGHGPRHPEMPNSAIALGLVDLAVPADAMGGKLAEYARSLRRLDGMAEGAEADGEHQRQICAILRKEVGHDFGRYKSKTFVRRVRRRMQVNQLDTTEGYVELLRRDPQEAAALFRDLLINVTTFFRDADAFQALADLVVPKLFEKRGAEDTVRVWVPGCATGEEVFSIAILLREHMDTLQGAPRVQLFATDIDEGALTVARAARYPATLLDGLMPERRRRFFVPDGGSYVISKEVRELCIFSPHSVLSDPPFSRIDLVSCRNLLIYFDRDAQGQIVPTFHYALRPGDYLFLGTSENVGQSEEMFEPIERKHRIFRRRSDVAASFQLPLSVSGLRPGGGAATVPRRPGMGGILLRQAVEAQVLERFAPAHVLVNRDGDVVFYSGRTGKYLEAAAGAPSRQLMAIARKGLRLDLRTVLRGAVDTGRTARCENVALEGEDGRVQLVTLTAEPLRGGSEGEPLFLVLFMDEGPPLSPEEAAGRLYALQDGAAVHLEREMQDMRDRLQSLVEEYETALEELKSSNEELVSVNEEMQSTNEEMEASKEELQSVNEELHTVNADLSSKMEALDRARADLQNLFDNTDVATVFLDRDLRIRSFTPAMTRLFNILPGDRGRPITDLASRFSLPGFGDDIAAVLAGHGPVEQRVDHKDGRTHLLVRFTPYHGTDRIAEGVVVTAIDVSSLTRAEARQRVLIAELQHRTRNLLAVVQSIALRTLGRGGSLDDYLARLSALGRMQGLIGRAADEQVELAELVRAELHALGTAEDGRTTVAGPPVSLDLERVQTLALALHELATNALKHGAFKQPDGRLAVAWSVEAGDKERRLVLDWTESGVPIPEAPARRGYGRELIERALAFTLKARAALWFRHDGVSCRIEVPLPPVAGPATIRSKG